MKSSSKLFFWSETQREIQITSESTNISLPAIEISNLPEDSSIIKAHCILKLREITNSSVADINSLKEDAFLQIKKGDLGDFINAIKITKDSWKISPEITEFADFIIGNINIKDHLAPNEIYHCRLSNISSTFDSLILNDLSWGFVLYLQLPFSY